MTESRLDASPSESERNRLLGEVLLAGIEEQRRARRWRIFFRLAWLAMGAVALLLLAFWGAFSKGNTGGGKHTALVELRGVIGGEGDGSGQD